MNGEHGFLISGMLFGLTAGVSPGPLLTLVITETLKHGKIEGMKVAAAPLITDAPIILFVVYILITMSKNQFVIGILTLFGACYVMYLGIGNITTRQIPDQESALIKKSALKQGIITNALNPHPYIFWMSIGAPIITRALNVQALKAVGFILGFYCLLIGAKVGIVFAVDRSKSIIKSKYYLYIIRFLGAALVIFGLLFVRDGIRILRSVQG
jgi:threonine/homoserine/homoserine lactone efflux protein